jgi:VWFA-related protein
MVFARSVSLMMLLSLSESAALAQRASSLPAPAKTTSRSTLTVNARMVAITAAVYDEQGRLVGGLNKDDFTVTEDGKPQTIRYFNRDSDLPLTIGLMVDTSGSQAPYAEDERRASASFLQEMMTRPSDRAFLERFYSIVLLLQPMTSDVATLQSSLRLLTAPIPTPKFSRGGTLLFDAICATAQKVVSKEAARRAIVILTDGDDDGSSSTLASAIHDAQLADVAVYSVLYTREAVGQSNGGYSAGIAAMQQISDATGGRLFLVTRGETIERIYAEIEADMRDQYRIGYTPAVSLPGKYHRIELKARDHNLTVQARTGYYAPQ